MEFLRGNQVDLESYLDYHDSNPTRKEPFSMRGKLLSSEDLHTTFTFITRAGRRNKDYNFELFFRTTAQSDEYFYLVFFLGEGGERIFEWRLDDDEPSLNTHGWDVIRAAGPGTFNQFIGVYIPPSAQVWECDLGVNNEVLQEPEWVGEAHLYQVQNDMVQGDRIVKWNSTFAYTEASATENGLSYDIALDGLYGGESE